MQKIGNKKIQSGIAFIVLLLLLLASVLACIASLVTTTALPTKNELIAASAFNGGSGTSSSPYQIATPEEFLYFSDRVCAGSTYNGQFVELIADIDMTDCTNFMPIGYAATFNTAPSTGFRGTFNGNGYCISNCTITGTSAMIRGGICSLGIFGTTQSATVKNLHVANLNITVPSDFVPTISKDCAAGGIIGKAIDTRIENCVVESSTITAITTRTGATSLFAFGGIVGDSIHNSANANNSYINNCHADVDIFTDQSGGTPTSAYNAQYQQYFVGGIVGRIRSHSHAPQNCMYEGVLVGDAYLSPIIGATRNTSAQNGAQAQLSTGDGVISSELTSCFYIMETGSTIPNPAYNMRVDTNGDPDPFGVEFVTAAATLSVLNSASYDYSWRAHTSNNSVAIDYIDFTVIDGVYDYSTMTVPLSISPIGNYSNENLNSIAYTCLWSNGSTATALTANIPVTIDASENGHAEATESYSATVTYNGNTYSTSSFSPMSLTLSFHISASGSTLVPTISASDVGFDTSVYTYTWYDESGNVLSTAGTYTLNGNEDYDIIATARYPQDTLERFMCTSRFAVNATAVFVDYAGTYGGVDTNLGTINSPVKTLARAYDLLSVSGTVRTNTIVLMSNYLPVAGSADDLFAVATSSTGSIDVFNKAATITSTYDGIAYDSQLRFTSLSEDYGKFLSADTVFEHLTFNGGGSYCYLYCRGNSLTMGEGIRMTNYEIRAGVSSNGIRSNDRVVEFHIIGSYFNYDLASTTNAENGPCNITILSGTYARIIGGCRTSLGTTGIDPVSRNIYGSVSDPFIVNITVNITDSSHRPTGAVTCDVGLVCGGQTDSTIYTYATVNIQAGVIGRVLGGSISYAKTVNVPQQYAVNDIIGAISVNISGGTIKELYGGSLGRGNSNARMISIESLVENRTREYDIEITISGGTIESDVYACGAGGIAGVSGNYYAKESATNPAVLHTEGNSVAVCMNISGGTIAGSVFGGGYGYSEYMGASDVQNNSGSLFGSVTLNCTGGSVAGNIFGGGKGSTSYGTGKSSLAQVTGNITVNVTGVIATDTYIFGGGMGTTETGYLQMAKVTGNTVVNVTDSTITYAVFGGGMDAITDGSTQVNVTNSTILGDVPITSRETASVIGGGMGIDTDDAIAEVLGSTAVTITDSTIGQEVFCGGMYALTGRAGTSHILTVTDSIMHANIFGAGMGAVRNPALGHVTGTAAVIVNETESGTTQIAGNIYGGGHSSRTYGNATVTINGGDIMDNETSPTWFDCGNVYGGGYGETAVVHGSSAVTVNGGSIQNHVFGGGYAGEVTESSTVTITGGSIRYHVMAGGNEGITFSSALIMSGGTVGGNVYGGGNMELAQTSSVTISGGIIQGNVVGASNNAGNADTTHITQGEMLSTVTVSGVTQIHGGIYGGCFQSGTVYGNTSVTMNGDPATIVGGYGDIVHYPVVRFRVFGGGYGVQTTISGNTNVYINGGTIGRLTATGELMVSTTGVLTEDGLTNVETIECGTVFGGGESGNVSGDTYVSISGGHIRSSVFGGGYGASASVHATTVIISGGEIGKNIPVNVVLDLPNYGYTIVDEPTADSIQIDKLTGGIVFGGGANGPVETNTSVTMSGGDILGSIYGSGYGASATVHGNTNINIVKGEIGLGVFGGGYASTVEGNVSLTIDGAYDEVDDVHDVRIGMLLRTAIPETTYGINTVGMLMLAGSVFGGGNAAEVWGDVSIFIGEAVIKDVMFGGGLGATATVRGDIDITIGTVYATTDNNALNTIIKDIYGGGYSGEVLGDITIQINTIRLGKMIEPTAEDIHGVFGGNLYGGGEFGDVSGNVDITIVNGSIFDSTFGGGKDADVGGNVTMTVYGGYFGVLDNEGVFNELDSEQSGHEPGHGMIFGGGENGSVLGDVNLTVDISVSLLLFERPGWFTNSVFGGGFGSDAAVYGNVTVNVYGDDELLLKNLFGGGFSGPVYGTIDMYVEETTFGMYHSDTTVIDGGHIYGGGLNSTVFDDITLNIHNSTVFALMYGGSENGIVNGDTYLTVDGCTVGIAVCGGGFDGPVRGTCNVTVLSSTVGGRAALFNGAYSVYAGIANSINTLGVVCGGGYFGDVNDTNVLISDNTVINQAVFGGGLNGNVSGDVVLTINSGEVNGVVYGGGYSGTAETTNVTIEDSATDAVKIHGNSYLIKSLFGGGEGPTATVYSSTSVRINLTNTGSAIDYSVYGGGDLGMVGTGVIRTTTDTYSIIQEASTSVLLENGSIGGNIFGGGNGKSASGDYNIYMGVLFGTATVRITGGTIGIDVFGCGNQSRVFSASGKNASYVYIDSTAGREILLTAGVFGGGNRGDSVSTSANTYTVFGDTYVQIIGQHVSFVENDIGGVFGDGNLCLVDGFRTIEILNFYSLGANRNKVFYSLQRADLATVTSSYVLLMGATDMVAEFDETSYSINRIGKLEMHSGSHIALYDVVNALGELTSDVNTDVDYRSTLPGNSTTMTPAFIEQYRAAAELETTVDNTHENMIAVANGKYLEIMDENGTYGPVSGLFTLQLLNAVQGEGGGFVYAEEDSFGDFICITKYPSGEYMDIVDSDILVTATQTPCHYWYIDGDNIGYIIDLLGFSGSSGIVDTFDITLPRLEAGAELTFDLSSIVVTDLPNLSIASPLAVGTYRIHMDIDGTGFLFSNGTLYDMMGNAVTNNVIYTQPATEGYLPQFSFSLELANGVEKYSQIGTVEFAMHTDTGLPTETDYAFEVNVNVQDRLASGQVFYATGNFYNGVGYSASVVMTDDSSFSCEFVTSYSPSIYFGLNLAISLVADPSLTGEESSIGNAIPIGTKIILIDRTYPSNPKYYYYICTTAMDEVQLSDFIEMGYTTRQAGYTGYTTNTIIREDLLFVFDFEDVVDTSFTGSAALLKHTYPDGANDADVLRYDHVVYYTNQNGEYTDENGVVLADQTQPVINTEETTYVYPPYMQFVRDLENDGIDSYQVTASNSEINAADDIELTVSLLESTTVTDSYYAEQDYAIRLSAQDENGDTVVFPTGTVFRCDGIIYVADISSTFVILPVGLPGEHTILIQSGLSGFTANVLNINTELFSSPDGTYHNNLDTTHSTQTTLTVSHDITSYYLKVSGTPRIISVGDTTTFTLQMNDTSEPVSVMLMRKDPVSLDYDAVNMRTAIIGHSGLAEDMTVKAGGVLSFTFANNATAGVYRFVFTYHDRTEYVNIIVK